MPFTVRPTACEDIPAVIEVVKASWARTYNPLMGVALQTERSEAKHIPELFLPEIDSDTGRSFVAEVGGLIVGHAGGFMKGEHFFVDRVHVDSDWHGKGVAAALLDTLKENLPAAATALELTVFDKNSRARAFYAKNGFREVNAHPFDVSGIDLVELVLLCPL